MATDSFDDETLREYLAETLPPGEMARVEMALRESSELRDYLEDIRQNRSEAGLHTLGAIWRRGRLTCPTRQQLGSYLLEVLDPEYAEYVTFHIETIGCPYCQANLDDLRGKTDTSPLIQNRLRRIYHSSRHLLSGEI